MTNERRKSHDQIKYKPNSYESSKIEPSGQLFFAVLKEIFLCRFCDIDDNTSNRRIAIDYNGDPYYSNLKEYGLNKSSKRRERIRSFEDSIDFNKEGREVMQRLNLDVENNRSLIHRNIDAIWAPAITTSNNNSKGMIGKIYVGNQSASKDEALLRSLNIRGIINCTHEPYKLPNVLGKFYRYYDFPICEWESHVNSTDKSVLDYFKPVFQFIKEHIDRKEGVLIHCLAGAHRAGTVGVASLMYFADLNMNSAIFHARTVRPIIDPTIGTLPRVLQRLDKAKLRNSFSNNNHVKIDDGGSSSIGVAGKAGNGYQIRVAKNYNSNVYTTGNKASLNRAVAAAVGGRNNNGRLMRRRASASNIHCPR